MYPVFTGGCIRLYPMPRGPEWHVNDHHKTFGLIDPTEDPHIDENGMLVFNLVTGDGGRSSYPVVTMKAEEDETLTARGISAGPQGGVGSVRIQFYKDGINGANGTPLNLHNETHYDRSSGDFVNIWFSAMHLSETPVQ